MSKSPHPSHNIEDDSVGPFCRNCGNRAPALLQSPCSNLLFYHPSHTISYYHKSGFVECTKCGTRSNLKTRTTELCQPCPATVVDYSTSPVHPSHSLRSSDSSLYDVKCTLCGGTDASGDSSLSYPCVDRRGLPANTVNVFPPDPEAEGKTRLPVFPDRGADAASGPAATSPATLKLGTILYDYKRGKLSAQAALDQIELYLLADLAKPRARLDD